MTAAADPRETPPEPPGPNATGATAAVMIVNVFETLLATTVTPAVWSHAIPAAPSPTAKNVNTVGAPNGWGATTPTKLPPATGRLQTLMVLLRKST